MKEGLITIMGGSKGMRNARSATERFEQYWGRLNRRQSRIDQDLGRIDQHERDIELLYGHRHCLTYRVHTLERSLSEHIWRYNNDRALVDNNLGQPIPGYDPLAVAREILALNCELGAALDLVTKLEYKLVRLKAQRDDPKESSTIWRIYERDRWIYISRFEGLSTRAKVLSNKAEGLRGGVGNDEYDDRFRVRHPECSSDTAESSTAKSSNLRKRSGDSTS
jgi:hypothetical protein